MTFKLNEPDFERHPLTKRETAFESLETSWCDFMYGARVTRYVRSERRKSLRLSGFDQVHRILDNHKQQFDEGDRSSIFKALIYSIEENVPLPYWLGDEILDINKRVNLKPNDLHVLFGLQAKLPVEGKRGQTLRRDGLWQKKLFVVVSKLIVKEGVSKESAIKQAREQLNFPYGQGKSREMFDEQELIQSGYLDALKGRKKHRVK